MTVKSKHSYSIQAKIDKTPQESIKVWFVYLLRCADNTLYCGITTNLQKRLRQHNGELVGGAKYTKVRQPCLLVYSEAVKNRSIAGKREHIIKKCSKIFKERLVHNFTDS